MGRNQYRGSNGKGRYNKSKQNSGGTSTDKEKKLELVFNIGTAKQASDFAKVKKACLNNIKGNYEQGFYIATALENGEDYDFWEEEPKPLKLEAETDEQGNALKGEALLKVQSANKAEEIRFKTQMDSYTETTKVYKHNKHKAYAYLWSKCSTAMKTAIESDGNYMSTIRDNPFELLKIIKTLSYNYQESKYKMAIVYDALKTFINIKQKDGEDLPAYLDRFKAASDNVKSQLGGELILTKCIQEMTGYDSTGNNDSLVKDAFEQFRAYIFIANSDPNKYGSLLRGLASQQSLKHNQYPLTLKDAVDVLNNHKWDDKYKEAQKKKKDKSGNSKKDDATVSTAPPSEI